MQGGESHAMRLPPWGSALGTPPFLPPFPPKPHGETQASKRLGPIYTTATTWTLRGRNAARGVPSPQLCGRDEPRPPAPHRLPTAPAGTGSRNPHGQVVPVPRPRSAREMQNVPLSPSPLWLLSHQCPLRLRRRLDCPCRHSSARLLLPHCGWKHPGPPSCLQLRPAQPPESSGVKLLEEDQQRAPIPGGCAGA